MSVSVAKSLVYLLKIVLNPYILSRIMPDHMRLQIRPLDERLALISSLQNTSDHAIRLLVDSVTRKFDFSESQEDMSLEIGFKAEAISLYRRLLGCSTDLVVGSSFPKKTVQIDQQSREYAFIWLNLWYE